MNTTEGIMKRVTTGTRGPARTPMRFRIADAEPDAVADAVPDAGFHPRPSGAH